MDSSLFGGVTEYSPMSWVAILSTEIVESQLFIFLKFVESFDSFVSFALGKISGKA